jgi:AcrR family transcriptional regulator
MSRHRTIADDQIFATIRRLLAEQGERGLSFAAVAAATGLAASTLVQRYGSVSGMLEAALAPVGAALDATLANISGEVAPTAKGAPDLLKALGDSDLTDIAVLAAMFRIPSLRLRAEDWRNRVETVLASQLGSAEAARLLFAAWQGQALWQPAGGRKFRLKDAVKRLT